MLPSSPKQDKGRKLVYDQVDCSICLEPLQHLEKQHITLINCNHTFHQTCILYAMKAQHTLHELPNSTQLTLEQIQSMITCPNCRQPILDAHLLYHPTPIKSIIWQTILYRQLQAFNQILHYIDNI